MLQEGGGSVSDLLTLPLATKQRGSHHRERAVQKVAAAHRTVRNQRRDLAHKLSRRLVNGYDLIVFEDLKITNMVRRPKPKKGEDGIYEPNGTAAKSGLNRSISDTGWGQLLQFLAYKAEHAGRVVIAVDPRHSSQRCSSCGHIDGGNRLTQATFRCQTCGHQAHADINAAINILRSGRARQASACVESSNRPTTQDGEMEHSVRLVRIGPVLVDGPALS
jgi:putative transposase